MALNVWKTRVGDTVREVGADTVLTVHRIDPPMSGGRAERYGPLVHAWIRPGGYGCSIDADTAHRYENC